MSGGRAAPVLALVVAAALVTGCERLAERAIERGLTRVERAGWRDDRLHVVLCGTGSPLPDAERAGACTAVLAGGSLYLVDVGPGAFEAADLAGLPLAQLRAVLLTHFHSDHIGDLGEALTQSWIAGRGEPLDVYGPPGTRDLVGGFETAYAADAAARIAHHGEAAMPAAGARAVAHELSAPDASQADPALVLERDGLRITAFAVDHAPVRAALGYRFDWRGRSVVVSGDTRASASLARAARGADLLVHEVLDAEVVERAADVAERLGRPRLAKLARDIPGYHTAPADAGRLAAEAGVRTLVFSHVVPPPRSLFLRRRLVAAAREHFGGEVRVGADGERFDLEPRH